MEASLRWDTDNDGIIDNAGFADQTYDAWTVTGARCVGSVVEYMRIYVRTCRSPLTAYKPSK